MTPEGDEEAGFRSIRFSVVATATVCHWCPRLLSPGVYVVCDVTLISTVVHMNWDSDPTVRTNMRGTTTGEYLCFMIMSFASEISVSRCFDIKDLDLMGSERL